MKRRINKKVVNLSIIALIFLLFSYTLHWSFIIPAIVIMFKNYKDLFGKK